MTNALRILVVEDDIDDARFALRALEEGDRSVDVEATPYPERALELLTEQRFDCVLLDYRLPRMNGEGFLEAMRENGLETPVVILTGRGSSAIADDLAAAGARGYLDKDQVSPETIRETLLGALGPKESDGPGRPSSA